VFVVAVGATLLATRVIGPRLRPRDLRQWSTLAKITTALVFVASIGVCDFDSYGFQMIDFKLHASTPTYYMRRQIGLALQDGFYHRPYFHLSKCQLDMLLAAAGVGLFLGSIALAYRSRSKIAAKWLAIVEHISVAPLAVAFGMASLVLTLSPKEGGPDDGAGYGALAMVGVLIAFTSMMLRRLRRSMIASG
jgi:hypothetical protein